MEALVVNRPWTLGPERYKSAYCIFTLLLLATNTFYKVSAEMFVNQSKVRGNSHRMEKKSSQVPSCFPALRLVRSLGRRLKKWVTKPSPARSDIATVGSESSLYCDPEIFDDLTWDGARTPQWRVRLMPSSIKGSQPPGFPLPSKTARIPPSRIPEHVTPGIRISNPKPAKEVPIPKSQEGQGVVAAEKDKEQLAPPPSRQKEKSDAPDCSSISPSPKKARPYVHPPPAPPVPPRQKAKSDAPGCPSISPAPKKSRPQLRPPPAPPAPPLQKNRIRRQPQVSDLFRDFVVGAQQLAATTTKGQGVKTPQKGGADVIGEMMAKSPFYLGIAKDRELHRGMIMGLIESIESFQGTDMGHLSSYVLEIESKLSVLTDESKVLEAFNWPARFSKMREAVKVHDEMSGMRKTFENWERCRPSTKAELQAMEAFLTRSTERIDLVMREEEAMGERFRGASLPWDPKIWMKTKRASLQLFLAYSSLAIPEVAARSPKDSVPILKGLVEFAYKTHTLAEGFCPACVAKFDEIRLLVATSREQEK
ncbi:hypothetical protein BSKO_05072 [Bryopsis sp. KO-2023]|nr:hypothetical protein BSKO_05072 [Bryopsis sp. KO-2023]